MRNTMFRISPTFVLVTINIAVYIYTSLAGRNFLTTSPDMLEVYGQSSYALLHSSSWWQLVTAMFVHVNIAHIAGNMFFLLLFGLRAEDFFSNVEYYSIYFFSGLTGNLLSLLYLFYPHYVTSAGASGAIFGVFGAVIIYLRKVAGGSILGSLLFAFMFFLITLSAGTNIYAHLGGLLIGIVIGYWLAAKRRARFTYQLSY